MNRVHRAGPATALNSAILHRHALHEDVLAIFTGACLISLGVVIQAQAQLLSGGIAGLSMFVARLAPVGFWIAFFVFNLPFCALAWRRGGGFVVRTLLAVTLTAALTERTAVWTGFATINPIYAAVAGGALIGIGLIVLFRHGTSLGGLGIFALVPAGPLRRPRRLCADGLRRRAPVRGHFTPPGLEPRRFGARHDCGQRSDRGPPSFGSVCRCHRLRPPANRSSTSGRRIPIRSGGALIRPARIAAPNPRA